MASAPEGPLAASPGQVLRETVAWCEAVAREDEPSGGLRTQGFARAVASPWPPWTHREVTGGERALARALRWRGRRLSRLVDSVVRTRRRRLRRLRIAAWEGEPPGRFLLFRPAEVIALGDALEPSRGVLGAGNDPPWDSWISCIRDREARRRPRWGAEPTVILSAYIPAVLVPSCVRATKSIADDSVTWVCDEDSLQQILET